MVNSHMEEDDSGDIICFQSIFLSISMSKVPNIAAME